MFGKKEADVGFGGLERGTLETAGCRPFRRSPMEASDCPTGADPVFLGVDVKGSGPKPGKNSVEKSIFADGEGGLIIALIFQRGYHGNFTLDTVQQKLVLFQNLLFRPAARAVKLDDIVPAFLISQTKNPVYIAVVGGETPVHGLAGESFCGGNDFIGIKGLKKTGGRIHSPTIKRGRRGGQGQKKSFNL